MKSAGTTVTLLVIIFLLILWKNGRLVRILNLAFQNK